MNYGRCTTVHDGSSCAGSSYHTMRGFKAQAFSHVAIVGYTPSEVYYWDAGYQAEGRILTARLWYCGKCHADLSFMKLLHDLKEGKLE